MGYSTHLLSENTFKGTKHEKTASKEWRKITIVPTSLYLFSIIKENPHPSFSLSTNHGTWGCAMVWMILRDYFLSFLPVGVKWLTLSKVLHINPHIDMKMCSLGQRNKNKRENLPRNLLKKLIRFVVMDFWAEAIWNFWTSSHYKWNYAPVSKQQTAAMVKMWKK